MFAKPKPKPAQLPKLAPWKVLVVDDEPDVHQLTHMVLRNFRFLGRGLELISAHSAEEARNLLQQHDDLALILLDVVMETDHAGLQLVHHIRRELKNRQVRLVLRTGQAGVAPERQVIVEYDINDYKEKTELTAQKLFTTVVASLRSYKENTDRLFAERALREQENRLRRHNRVIMDLTKRKILALDDLPATIREVNEAAARTLEVRYVSTWFYDAKKRRFDCANFYDHKIKVHSTELYWQPDRFSEYLRNLEETATHAISNIQESEHSVLFNQKYFTDLGTTALLEVTIRRRHKLIGVMRCEHVEKPRFWAPDEENFAVTMGDIISDAYSIVEHNTEIRERARMESELQTASAVQKALFPKSLPQIPHLQFASFFQSALETGGDWYGFLTSFERHVFILIGDATGHGTPSALLTATASATSRTLETLSQLYGDLPTPTQLLTHLNEAIYETGYPNFWMTFFVARIDLDTGLLTYSNAAHNFPILLQANGSLKSLLNSNSHLGSKPQQPFTENHLTLEVGDTLFFFTDGLLENTNLDQEMWGVGRLRRYLRKHRELPVNELIDQLIETLQTFQNGYPLDDDLTVVACRVVQPFGS